MIDFIKRLFCKYEFEDISGRVKIFDPLFPKHPIRYERTFICKKCLKKRTMKY